MARSQISICNFALVKLGAQTIISLLDDTKNAKLCNQYYEQVVDEVLRSHPWNSAIHRAGLARLADPPAFGFSYQYALPTSPYCLRVLRMENWDSQFWVEGRVLLTDEETCNIIYIKRIIDPNEFDPLLVEAIATRLAMELSYPITQSNTMKEQMAREFQEIIREARSIDAQEGTPETLETNTWLNARVGW